jgi:hypothetical protein
MTTTNGFSQYIFHDGHRALYDAYDCSLHHSNTDQTTSGILSHELEMWFSSVFNYQMYMYEHNLGPFSDPKYRSQMKDTMESTANRCCPKDIIDNRMYKYNIQ